MFGNLIAIRVTDKKIQNEAKELDEKKRMHEHQLREYRREALAGGSKTLSSKIPIKTEPISSQIPPTPKPQSRPMDKPDPSGPPKLARTQASVPVGVDRALSKLPRSSGLNQAIRGYPDPSGDPTDSSSGDIDGKDTEKGGGGGKRPPKKPYKSDDSNSDNDLFWDQLESDHDRDSEDIKKRKQSQKRKAKARLAHLKFHQGFIKQDPPKSYNGEVNAGKFKCFCCEVYEYKCQSSCGERETVRLSGKWLTGKAY